MKPRLSTRPQVIPPGPSAAGIPTLSPRIFIVVACCLAAAVVAVYSPALNFQFILDDHRFTADPRIQSSGYVWDYFANFVWAQYTGGPPSFYRPIFLLWMRVNFILCEMSPWGWHLLSIAKHLIVAGMLGLLVWKLLRDRIAALMAASLFALHPAQAESVAWVTVPDPLMACGVLGCLLLYLKYSQDSPGVERSGRKSRQGSPANQASLRWTIAAAIACLLSLMAKETAIVLPTVIFALALLSPSDERNPALETKRGSKNVEAAPSLRLARAIRQTLPFLVATALYFVLRLNALSWRLSSRTQHLSATTVLLSWPAILWFYAKAIFWPVRSSAFADPIVVERFSARTVLVPVLGVICIVIALSAVSFWAWRKAARDLSPQQAGGVRTAIVIGALLLVLPLLLTLDLNALNPGDFLHGRYTYLPLAGLMLIVATVWHLLGKGRILVLGATALLVVVFASLTFAQESMWKDDLTVFTVAHQLAPHNAPVAQNLANAHVQQGLALGEQGRCAEAVLVFEQVTQDYPQDWYAWAALGDCLVQLNNLPRAEESLHRAADISHDPRVIEQWQQMRAQMGLPVSVPQ